MECSLLESYCTQYSLRLMTLGRLSDACPPQPPRCLSFIYSNHVNQQVRARETGRSPKHKSTLPEHTLTFLVFYLSL